MPVAVERSDVSRRSRGRTRAATVALVVGLLFSAPASAQEEGDRAVDVQVEIGMKVGQLHPYFRLPAADGGEREFHSLAEFRGRRLLLFHFASW